MTELEKRELAGLIRRYRLSLETATEYNKKTGGIKRYYRYSVATLAPVEELESNKFVSHRFNPVGKYHLYIIAFEGRNPLEGVI